FVVGDQSPAGVRRKNLSGLEMLPGKGGLAAAGYTDEYNETEVWDGNGRHSIPLSFNPKVYRVFKCLYGSPFYHELPILEVALDISSWCGGKCAVLLRLVGQGVPEFPEVPFGVGKVSCAPPPGLALWRSDKRESFRRENFIGCIHIFNADAQQYPMTSGFGQ